MSAVEVICDSKNHNDDHYKKNSFSVHDLPARRSARKFAITCGKKIMTTITIAENHKRKVLSRLGLQLHCLARQDL